MSLPRPASVFDAMDVADATAKRTRVTGPPEEVQCDVTECSDELFEKWLQNAKPTIGDEKLYVTQMLQAWMTLSLAATEASVAYTEAVHGRSDESPDQANMPCYRSLGCDEYRQEEWEQAQEMLKGMKNRALMLVARAAKVQPRVNLIV